MLQYALFSSSEAFDGFLNALEDFFFTENGEDGREVGAGLLTGDSDAHRRHNGTEAEAALFDKVVEGFVDGGFIEAFQCLENFDNFGTPPNSIDPVCEVVHPA